MPSRSTLGDTQTVAQILCLDHLRKVLHRKHIRFRLIRDIVSRALSVRSTVDGASLVADVNWISVLNGKRQRLWDHEVGTCEYAMVI